MNNLMILGKTDRGLRSETASEHGPAKHYAQCQPDNSKKDCREHISQKMRTQRNTTEPYQGDQAYRTENGQQPPMARFEAGQNKKQKLPVQKSSSNSVTAGKTVTRP